MKINQILYLKCFYLAKLSFNHIIHLKKACIRLDINFISLLRSFSKLKFCAKFYKIRWTDEVQSNFIVAFHIKKYFFRSNSHDYHIKFT